MKDPIIKAKMVDDQIKIEQTFDFSDKHKEALFKLSNGMFEFRGKATEEEMDIHIELDVMGLAEDVEDAWHPSWKITEAGRKVVEQIKYEI